MASGSIFYHWIWLCLGRILYAIIIFHCFSCCCKQRKKARVHFSQRCNCVPHNIDLGAIHAPKNYTALIIHEKSMILSGTELYSHLSAVRRLISRPFGAPDSLSFFPHIENDMAINQQAILEQKTVRPLAPWLLSCKDILLSLSSYLCVALIVCKE